MREIYERSARTFTVSFLDADNALVAPSNARWKLWNITANEEVVAWTVISAPTTSESITINASYNKIRTGRDKEIMELVVQSDYDDEDSQQTKVTRYAIKNVVGVNDSDGT